MHPGKNPKDLSKMLLSGSKPQGKRKAKGKKPRRAQPKPMGGPPRNPFVRQ